MPMPSQYPSPRLSWGILLVRILVGWVFLSEGIQKFLFPAALGTGRFAKVGIPWPQYSAPFVGVVEIVCGTLVIVGLFTSLASVLLLIVIAVAIATTKVPMLLNQGLWATLHEARTDFSMLFGLIAILLMGAGIFSLNWRRNRPITV
ncbi:MAG: DoxX family protein [Terriglobia bacterium]